jgi:uncharacterized protein (TIGR03067 family)
MKNLWLPLRLSFCLAGLIILVLWRVISSNSPVGQSELESTHEDRIGQEKQLLKGSWKGLWGEFEGKKVEFQKGQEVIYVFDENKLVIKATDGEGEQSYEESYEIDPTRHPKTIDMTVTARVSSTFKGVTKVGTVKHKVQGIYKVEENRLTIAQGPPNGKKLAVRPSEFVTNPGSPVMIYVFDRLAP